MLPNTPKLITGFPKCYVLGKKKKNFPVVKERNLTRHVIKGK